MIRPGPDSAIIVRPSARRWKECTSTFCPALPLLVAESYSQSTLSVRGALSTMCVQESWKRTLPFASMCRSWIGPILCSHSIGPIHDLHMLANGNVLFQLSWTHIVEMD